LSSVDYVAIFTEVRATHFFERIRPAIYVKGGDYTPESLNAAHGAVLERIGCDIRITPFERGYPTTQLIERMHSG